MRNSKFLTSFKELLELKNQPVTEIEMTASNFDDSGKLIKDQVPTLTTNFCEIGIISGEICYFTIILRSDFFPKPLFDLIQYYEGIHIYGFKNFLKDYYPKNNFSFDKLQEQIKKEPYFQIQFNFNTRELDFEEIFQKYIELKETFSNNEVKVINQMA